MVPSAKNAPGLGRLGTRINTAHLALSCTPVELNRVPLSHQLWQFRLSELLVSQPLCATWFGSFLFPGDAHDRAVEIVH